MRKLIFSGSWGIWICMTLCALLLSSGGISAQGSPELETALMKFSKIWAGVTANGGKRTFEFRAGFFPNDRDIMGQRGQYAEGFTAAGFTLSTTKWFNPYVDSVQTVSVYKMTNEFKPVGEVVTPLSNYIRYKYSDMAIDFQDVTLEDFGEFKPDYSAFQTTTCDQIVEVKNQTIFGVTIDRKLMTWSQTFNDDYIIADVTFTNESPDTLHDFYIQFQESAYNIYFSNGMNPAPQSSERFYPSITWQHYYGGRPGDSLRVFYEYSADDPRTPGDNMGAPVSSQGGRLLNPNMIYYTILHASKEPYSNPADDADDPLQPKVTYIGKETNIPFDQANDEFGSKNYYAIRGGYSNDYPMPGSIPGTFHGLNNDELGITDYSSFVAGYYRGQSVKASSFGPYNFAPGKKIRLVYASGFTGIGYKKGQEVGAKWLDGTLENPPNMPDPNTGWLPSNFAFPADATEMDKRKDRWISMGIDSVMLSAYRAKWNFEHNYQIPQAPAPPDYVTVTGYGDGVEIVWADPAAEAMSNFAGYRIMRKVSKADTLFYEPVYDSDAGDKAAEHVYKDKSVLFGAQYYYYVQAKAQIDVHDPNADPTTRGKIIYSSRVLQPNIYWINPPRTSSDDMSKIRIVPNPYNINDPLLVTYGFTDQRGIIFFNLPGTVKIKIFTENGDLIQTIDHDSPVKAGSVTWDMITSSQQVISSGIYIAVFEKPSGEISYQKFAVIR